MSSTLWQNARYNYVDEVPVQDFFCTYMSPGGRRRKVKVPHAVEFSGLVAATTPRRISRALADSIKEYNICPDFRFAATMDDSDTRPSIACYRKDSFRITSVARHWQALEMFVTYTVTEPEDQYYDCPNSGSDDESHWDDGYHVNEDIRYAVSQFSHQHRTFLFSLHITNTLPRSSGHVRFCRWDRAGIVLTEPFDYGREPRLLAEFFVRYNKLSAARRGFDTTAAPATQAESKLLADAIKEHLGKIKAEVVPPMHYLHLTLDKDYPTYKIHLPEIGLFGSLEVIVRRPISQDEVLVGKCTRGYVGFLLGEDRLVFVKDYWAAIDEQDHYVMSEVDACHHTRLHKIPHLPNMQHVAYVTTGDSTPQTTETPELSHSYDKISRRQHIRIVQDLVYNIQAVRNSKQLVQAIRDVLVAIDAAWRADKLVHRDISANNVMFTADGRGALIDWDLAMLHSQHVQRQTRRVGTEWYASCDTLKDMQESIRKGPHTIQDDIESCFWVLLILSNKHCMGRGSSHPTMARFFTDNSVWKREEYLEDTEDAEDVEDVEESNSAPLTELLRGLKRILGEYRRLRGCAKRLPWRKRRLEARGMKEPEGFDEDFERSKEVVALMEDAQYVISLFDKALAQDGWPEHDIECRFREYDGMFEVQLDPCLGVVRGIRLDDVLAVIPAFKGDPNPDVKTENKLKRRSEDDVEAGPTKLRRSKRIKAQHNAG